MGVVATADFRDIRGRLMPARVSAPLGLVLLAAALVCAACGDAAAQARICVTVPQSIPQEQLVLDGGSRTASVGTVLYVVLVEPEMYAGPRYPRGFPWQAPRSADSEVLERVQRSTALPEPRRRAPHHVEAAVLCLVGSPHPALSPARVVVVLIVWASRSQALQLWETARLTPDRLPASRVRKRRWSTSAGRQGEPIESENACDCG